MELPKPQTVRELGDRLSIPIIDLLIPCRFCNRFLPYIDLLAFDYKTLQLIWTEEDFVFACCCSCAHASAQFEFTKFYEFSVIGKELEQVEHQHIGAIPVRCHYCLRLLDLLEKLEVCYTHQQFHKVRGNWKARCRHCGVIE
ncbi:transforming protein [Human papillomavirus 145]|uniref:Protein E6 n=2 Tax=Papillomaviridae TaxID=151340 RepID=A0A1Q1PPG0_9PAPI|nr:transforming protein [Human papillomavirus 145]AQM73697.1 E6 [Human papillomavirus]